MLSEIISAAPPSTSFTSLCYVFCQYTSHTHSISHFLSFTFNTSPFYLLAIWHTSTLDLSLFPLASSSLSHSPLMKPWLQSHLPLICLNGGAFCCTSCVTVTSTFHFSLHNSLRPGYYWPPWLIFFRWTINDYNGMAQSEREEGVCSEWSSSLSINRKPRVHDDMILCANTESSLRGGKGNGVEDCGVRQDLVIPAVLYSCLTELLFPYLR